ncbi:SDR family NAD(P)-dependent oxidoreductase [Amycolatopsis saalfeldensis]|uniref:NADP-dependent 3-hydroxy acid dehydrogenase YdfG n=1 Tax=Amycolatopsis saalfeldensis TaxID=394193 RepID=A0A1H8TBC8_9PSEU|nr:SDR family NAD(P)-dependent oxidoreductase [Amycolatopsis saalfeldensis]SEO88046.1 NADP-dependent 3-hydroxy acid dehydrogenase YdfG [Amycolatopsis saalfeldensis]
MGKVWLVTGGSRGLGRAVVEEALAAGHQVVATARSIDSLKDLDGRYAETLLRFPLDVTDPAQAQAAVAAAVERFGRLDVVVNNASYANTASVEEVELDDFRAQIEAVFFGTVHVTKAALPVFLAQHSGHFIQVTSIGGRGTAPGVSAYQSAKFATEGFSGVLNDEVSRLGVKVTMAELGLMRTDWSGPSMTVRPYKPEYEPTIGPLLEHLAGARGAEPIDPAKVARVFLEITELDEPPLHLVLGRDAVEMIKAGTEKLRAEDARWAELGRSVDFAS